MNPFVEHHQQSIRFQYSCFDRMLLNAVVQPMQQPAMIVGFLDKCRQVPSITKAYLRDVSDDYHRFVGRLAAEQRVPIIEPPRGVRREDWVEPFYQRLGSRFGIAVILKSRENARIAVSYATPRGGNRIEVLTRFVWQYYFYLRDRDWGRMFVRVSTYFPFNARVCVNQHEWLARQLQREGIFFRKAANAFVQCADPQRLQHLADGLTPSDLEVPVQGWLRELVPFYASTDSNRMVDCVYRLFCSQVEYCTNLIFKERAALDRVAERLLDLNRNIGRPDKLSTVFGYRITKRYRGGLKTQIADHHLGNPVIRSEYKDSSIKQYVRDHRVLRTEATSYNTWDLGIGKSISNLPQLRRVMHGINDRYLAIQQDVLETYIDRGQLARLRQPTISASGRRTPGLKLDDPRLLAVMQALTCFIHVARAGRFRTRDLHQRAAETLGLTTDTYRLGQLRYDLAKLRAKGLVVKVPKTQTYRLTAPGFRICVVFLKLAHRVYAPFAAAVLEPVQHDAALSDQRRAQLDQLYAGVDHALDALLDHLGVRPAA
ncbi:MAG: hypothetical protein JOZ81_05295 [Chloroflexi bacterium]|nr:hypothetical protein [Chloroflexota bacterium]